MKKTIVLLVLFSLVLSFAITGKEVLDKVRVAHRDFITEKSVVTLKLIDSNSSVVERKFDMYLMNKGDNTLALVRFTAPADIRRTTLLTLSDNEIYLYMPAYRRTKRISSGAKNGKFVGSDFKYSDISLMYNEQSGNYKSTLLKNTEDQYVVEVTPLDSNNDYGKIVITVDKSTLLFKHIDFYDKKVNKIKVMDFLNVKNFGKHTIATTITLKDLTTGHKTVLDINSVQFSIPITSKFFDRRNISRPVLRYR
jgi:hypothetical protein